MKEYTIFEQNKENLHTILFKSCHPFHRCIHESVFEPFVIVALHMSPSIVHLLKRWISKTSWFVLSIIVSDLVVL